MSAAGNGTGAAGPDTSERDDESFLAEIVSRQMTALLGTAELRLEAGCCCLGMAFARWVERCPEVTGEQLTDILRVHRRVIRDAFLVLRDIRNMKDTTEEQS